MKGIKCGYKHFDMLEDDELEQELLKMKMKTQHDIHQEFHSVDFKQTNTNSSLARNQPGH